MAPSVIRFRVEAGDTALSAIPSDHKLPGVQTVGKAMRQARSIVAHQGRLMHKRGEHTSQDARPDEKMSSEARWSGRLHSSKINRVLKRAASKKRRQRSKEIDV